MKHFITTFSVFLFTLVPAFAQRVITTYAGADWLFPGDGRPAINAPLGGTLSLDLATDRNGNYYICDEDNSMVMRVGPDGIINVVAGNPSFNGTFAYVGTSQSHLDIVSVGLKYRWDTPAAPAKLVTKG